MAYCTQDDILEQLDEDILIQLTDDADDGAVDAAKVTRAIARADAEINAHVQQAGHALPLSPVPDVIRDKSVDLAIYHLYSRRGNPPTDVVDRKKDAIRFLEKVMTGALSLGAETPAVADADRPVRTNTDKDDRTFTMTTMEGF